jgi:D-alanyl-lipoteichoic acid acyltransferase DltB (MBOAT superfamily)
VYRGRLAARRNFVDFAAFLALFPQLVAGPIERATHVLPQVERRRRFDPDAARGALLLICWGVFKKIVIADNVAVIAGWHISLSTWFRDYVYIPLGGNRGSGLRRSFNVLLTFLLSGLWHGASWNFVLWGAYHGALLIAQRGVERVAPGLLRVRWLAPLRVAGMFALVTVGWLMFARPTCSSCSPTFSCGPAATRPRSGWPRGTSSA